jgi:drug/metabolite transporter (DMT)-like permease
MSAEGVMLIARAALVTSLIIAAATFRALVGPGKRRGRIMLAGTLSGIFFGVLIAYPISQWLKIDVSAVCACLGMTIGWTVSWLFARQVAREH